MINMSLPLHFLILMVLVPTWNSVAKASHRHWYRKEKCTFLHHEQNDEAFTTRNVPLWQTFMRYRNSIIYSKASTLRSTKNISRGPCGWFRKKWAISFRELSVRVLRNVVEDSRSRLSRKFSVVIVRKLLHMPKIFKQRNIRKD